MIRQPKSACSFRRVESENVLKYNVSVRTLNQLFFFSFLEKKKGQGILYLEITICVCGMHNLPSVLT